MTRNEGLRKHYLAEIDYAAQIKNSPKGSEERRDLFEDGYNKITEIISTYNKDGGETDYTKVVYQIIRKLKLTENKVFDLGCASGNLISKLLSKGYYAKGIDVSTSLIKRGIEKYGDGITEHIKALNILDYPSSEKFNLIVLDNVIEHFVEDEIDDVIAKCHEMLTSPGYVIIFTPHRFSGPHDISRHFIPFGSKSSGFHFREYSFSDLSEMLKRNGFSYTLGFTIHPRLLRYFNITPSPSRLAACKAIWLEELFSNKPFRYLLKINSTISRGLVSLLFPAVCIGVKR